MRGSAPGETESQDNSLVRSCCLPSYMRELHAGARPKACGPEAKTRLDRVQAERNSRVGRVLLRRSSASGACATFPIRPVHRGLGSARIIREPAIDVKPLLRIVTRAGDS